MRLYLLFTLLFTSFMFGQLSDKHWLPPLHSRSAGVIGQHVVYLSTPEVTPFQVTVTNGNGLPVGTYTISSGSPAQFTVGTAQPSDMFVNRSGLHTVSGDDGLIISGSSEFYVTFKLDAGAHGEMFVSKGRAGIGKDFRLGSSPQGGSDSFRNFVSSFMATENNTVVTISDYGTGVTFTTPTATNNNGSQIFTLQAGQSVVLSGYADVNANWTGFIGARLTATKPVAVITGNVTVNPSTQSGNDVCLDQIVPIEKIGTQYVLVKGNGTVDTELPIVIATEDNTQVFVNGNATPITTINTGDYYIVPFSYFQGAFNQNMYIETTKPVYLYQILAGSTASYTVGLNFIPPLSCSYPKVVDLIPSINSIGSGVTFAPNDTNVILIAVAGSVISLNGVQTTAFPQPVPGNSNWVTYRISGLTGNVKVESTGSTAVAVLGLEGTMGVASFYSGFGTVNLTYQAGQGAIGLEESDMTIANGLAPCPGDIRVLNTNLEPADFSFEWTVDTGSGPVVLTGETGPSYTVTSPGTYCVTTSNGFIGSNCTQTDCVVVEYQPGFVINNNPDDLLSCNNDFDLSENSATILNGLDPFTYDVLFYATMQDAIDNINQIPALQTTTATVTTFYVRVETFGSTCAQITQFDAVVSPCQASTAPDMIVCDDITNNGTETFNLTTQNAAVLGGLAAADFTITYHLDQAGADADNNLALPATAYVGGPNQVIYVRMESNANPTQYSTSTFNLIVNPLPTAAIGASTICSGQTATVTISGTPGATVSYLDNLGVTQTVVLNSSGSATVTTPVLTSNATYSLVDVTSVENCTRAVNGSATVTVLPLPTASISANTICEGTAGTVTITGTPNATVNYTVDSGSIQTIILNGSGTAVITSPVLTSDSVYCVEEVISATTPACSATLTNVCASITVLPLPTAVISANTTCVGSTGTVTITGTANATVTYTVDAGINQTIVLDASGNASITSPVLTANSEYCLVDVTSNTTPACTQTVTSCATITVLPLPTATLVANTVCSGTSGTVTITGTANATVTYTVDAGANQTVVLNASGTGTITTPILTANSQYCLVNVTSNTTPACTQTLTACATVTINPLPTVSISTTTPSICSGTSATIDFAGTANATITYTIDGVSSTIVLDGSGNASVSSTATSTYCLVGAASNSTPVCTQAFTDCVTITVIPLPTASITGDTICDGD
uniref:IgGFc-binding protein n=2 Tax=Flavobacterium gelidilacus TaxID=206041 RepID=UPI0012FCD2E3